MKKFVAAAAMLLIAVPAFSQHYRPGPRRPRVYNLAPGVRYFPPSYGYGHRRYRPIYPTRPYGYRVVPRVPYGGYYSPFRPYYGNPFLPFGTTRVFVPRY